jgi:SAM-dependent methyltransferase
MPGPRLYAQLADWWPVLSDPADYEEEAAIFRAALDETSGGEVRTVLELGSGGGNNASWLKQHYAMTLVEPSLGMREVSRALNPECRHAPGDMRHVRLDESFDAVFIHDAIMYMTTEADLRAALRTAHAHCRPGGVALFVPDDTTETFRPGTKTGGHDRGARSLRYLAWTFDPDPDDTEFHSVYAFLLREGDGAVRCEHDEHVLGLFPHATWLRLIEEAGFAVSARPFPHSDFETPRELFLGVARG